MDVALDQATAEISGGARANRGGMTDAEIAHAAVLEQMAHGATYQGGHTGGNVVSTDSGADGEVDRRAMLIQNGYNPEPRLVHGTEGFEMVVFEPAEGSDAEPVVSFRGTEELRDGLTDADLEQVGERQYAANQELIADQMAEVSERYGRQVEVTGHSLGGSLAQRAAANNPDATGHITTFQAPGIAAEDVARLEEANRERIANGEEPIGSDHFQVDGCLVSRAGQDHTPGEVHDIRLGSVVDDQVPTEVTSVIDDNLPGGLSSRTDPYTAHTALPLTAMALETEEGRRALPGIQEQYDADPTLSLPEVDNVRTSEVDNSGTTLNEQVRSGAGAGLRLAEIASRAVIDRGEGAVDSVQGAVDRGVDTAATVVDMGQGAVQNVVDLEDSVIDGGQSLVRGGNDLSHAVIDRGQQLASQGAAIVPGGGALVNGANEMIDSGQGRVDSVIEQGGATIDRAQRSAGQLVASGQHRVDEAQQTVASTVARGQRAVNGAQARIRQGWEWLSA